MNPQDTTINTMATGKFHEALDRFRRQYFQLVDTKELAWPPHDTLRDLKSQTWLFKNLFDIENITYLPPERYRLRVLKQLLRSIEDSICDPEEDEISDDLSSALAVLMSRKLPTEATAAQQSAYVTYSFPSLGGLDPAITLLESRSVIASSGTTGRRTWEAALHLSRYLVEGKKIVKDKHVLELGAGTGLVSILCARWLGAKHVTATDGDDSVVEDMQKNIFLNGLEGDNSIYAKSLKWGHVFEEDEAGQSPYFDVVLGADITYDVAVVPALVATFRELLVLNSHVDIIIASAIRNADTFAAFVSACERAQFSVVNIDFPIHPTNEGEGPFYATTCPIRIVRMQSKDVIQD
ncbi:uncharacterized protein PV09_06631 [Verruconis gallopava]|uniref:FAM86 N-terminal domain-containing protein n=1 Tax=Verruconis gallopava TaxID=253628 RepID=A0A0D1XIJ7_9PEZI|nr:uncharacterized protein PV09_06631 [Verruconis gallopava]KIW02146.1 hypothetical protein PV09_06631 [Verruconis gallopava]